ncbi:MAG: hypothetical protein CMI12_12375 [Oceanospirillum sp.]|nr:hypothetical protein [Oceanospirillum sp.]
MARRDSSLRIQLTYHAGTATKTALSDAGFTLLGIEQGVCFGINKTNELNALLGRTIYEV